MTVYSQSAGSLFLFVISHAVVICCRPKRLGTGIPRWQLALTVHYTPEDSAFTHPASFHNDRFEQFWGQRERGMCECHTEIMGLILLSLHKYESTLLSNHRDWKRLMGGKWKGKRGSVYKLQSTEKRKKERDMKKRKRERLNDGEKRTVLFIVNNQWLLVTHEAIIT